MRLVYVGPYLDVAVPDLGVIVRRGEPFDVPAGSEDAAKRLLEQPDVWQEDHAPNQKAHDEKTRREPVKEGK